MKKKLDAELKFTTNSHEIEVVSTDYIIDSSEMEATDHSESTVRETASSLDNCTESDIKDTLTLKFTDTRKVTWTLSAEVSVSDTFTVGVAGKIGKAEAGGEGSASASNSVTVAAKVGGKTTDSHEEKMEFGSKTEVTIKPGRRVVASGIITTTPFRGKVKGRIVVTFWHSYKIKVPWGSDFTSMRYRSMEEIPFTVEIETTHLHFSRKIDSFEANCTGGVAPTDHIIGSPPTPNDDGSGKPKTTGQDEPDKQTASSSDSRDDH
ncbi:hypothetical protein [Pontixanthobacter sp. CEM42]|uniref:hypothetical protein n=1 Tax=Pontixanthobacter sp. CEM42 TaxID=2792077 RepID=UPI001AE070F5|nr:hypothetical protein [Pontixanthobacter sp. CEM42]